MIYLIDKCIRSGIVLQLSFVNVTRNAFMTHKRHFLLCYKHCHQFTLFPPQRLIILMKIRTRKLDW